MNKLLVGLLLASVSALALAEGDPNRRLAEQYLKESRAEEISAAQIDGTVQQYSASMSPGAAATMKQYFNSSYGWGAVGEKYTSLVAKAFTADELKAAIAYMRTPLGASFAKKNVALSREMAVVAAANMVKTNSQGYDYMSTDSDVAERPSNDVVTAEVEEHNVGGHVYFTGILENRGNRPARNLQVEVNLFSSGKFVDQYTTYVSGIIAPGATR